MSTAPERPYGRRTTLATLTELWDNRELLVTLVRKDLKVRYRGTSLGFLWSMLNPALYLAVFYVVFQLILRNGIPLFAVYLLSGLLIWNLFSTGISGAASSVVDNQALVKKVYLPRAIFPLAAVGSALVHFTLQFGVLFTALVLLGQDVAWSYLWLCAVALIVVLILTSAIGIALSALNVRNRDVTHFLELALLAWFWMTPIVYPFGLVQDNLGERSGLALLNPITPAVLVFQRAIYARVSGPAGQTILPDRSQLWYLGNIAILGIVSVIGLVLALAYFRRAEGDFAEEL